MKKSLQKYWKKTRAISPLQNTNSTADQSIVGSDDNFETFAIVSTTSQLLEEAESGVNRTVYILSLINRFIGIANLWRFSFMAYLHNGGSFLLCYLFLLLTIGVPMSFLEISLGQFTSKGLLRAFHCIYIMKGLTYAMALVSFYSVSYFSVITAYLIKYWLFSFSAKIPWTTCKTDLTEISCIDLKTSKKDPCHSRSIDCGNAIFSTENFWDRNILHVSALSGEASNDAAGAKIVPFVIFVWIILFGMLVSPITVSGKLVYFTSTAPYILLFMLMINNFTLQGAAKGLIFYFTPKFNDFLEPKVWKAAASQVFISLMICTGGLIHMSSFNSFQNNCFMDTFLITGFNSLVSVIMGATVFSFLGNQASIVNRTITAVLRNSSGVSFIGFSGTVTNMPAVHLWSLLFFGLFAIISFGNLFWASKAVVTVARNKFPEFLKQRLRLSTGVVCFLYFVFTIIFAGRNSQKRIYFLDYYGVSYPVLLIGLVEVLSITYIYGVELISSDIKMMIGIEPGVIICELWSIIAPSILVVILVANILQEEGLKLGGYIYSTKANVFGWFLFFSSVIFIPVKALIHIKKKHGSGLMRLRAALKPHYKWRPYQKEDRVGKYAGRIRASIPLTSTTT